MKTFDWDYSAPQSPQLGDHDVPVVSGHLRGKRVALLVCGGIAAMKAPLLARALRRRGAEVVAFCSQEALHYVGREALEWSTCNPLVTQLTWRAEHLSDGAPFDAYLVAPATYNTIGKMAAGIADTVVTSALASALGRLRQRRTEVLVAPTMHGSMHHEILVQNCQALAALGVRFVTPRDDYGKHNLPDEELLVAAVCRAVSRSQLRGRRVLVTGGPTPVPLDGVRRVVHRSRGRLGAAVHEELLLRGADSTFLLGDGGWRPAGWMPVEVVSTYGEYREKVLAHVQRGFAAAVFCADEAAVGGMGPGGQAPAPTETLQDLVRAADPALLPVSFEFLEGASHEQLLAEARRRLDRAPVVVANRGAQAAYLVTRDGELRLEGKGAMASALADLLERHLAST